MPKLALIIAIIVSYVCLTQAGYGHDDDYYYDGHSGSHGHGHGSGHSNSHWSYNTYPPNWIYDDYYYNHKGKKNWFCKADEFWPLSKLQNGTIVENVCGRYDGKAKHYASVMWPCPPQPGGIGTDGHSWVHLGEYENECLGNLSLCTNGLTVSLWIKMISLHGHHKDGYYVSAGGLKDFFRIALFSGKHPYFIASVGNFIYYSTIPSKIIGKWAHILFTFNGIRKFRLYVNTKECEVSRYRYSPSHYNFTKFYLGRSIHHKTTTSAKFSQVAVWYHKLNWHDICKVYLGSRKTLKRCQAWYKKIKCDKETSSIVEQPSTTSVAQEVTSSIESSSLISSIITSSDIEEPSSILTSSDIEESSSIVSSSDIEVTSSIVTSSDVETTSSVISSTSLSTFIFSRSVSTISSRRMTTTRVESLVLSTPAEISSIEESEISSFEIFSSEVSSDVESSSVELTSEISSIVQSSSIISSSIIESSSIESTSEVSSIVEASSVVSSFVESEIISSEVSEEISTTSFFDIESLSTQPLESLSSICIQSTKTVFTTTTTSRLVISCPPLIETVTMTTEELVFTCPSVCPNFDLSTKLPHH